MQTKNLIIFVLLTAVLMGVWYLFQPANDSLKKNDAEKGPIAENKKTLPEDKKKDEKPPDVKKIIEPEKKAPQKSPRTSPRRRKRWAGRSFS